MSHLFAHPVLAPWLSDYVAPASFDLQVGQFTPTGVSDERLSIEVEFQLQCVTLESLVADGHASYAILATSPRTMFRELSVHPSLGSNETSLSLRMSDFAHDITLTPYLVAMRDLVVPVTKEHDSEFLHAGRIEFALPSGAILAVGDGIRLSHDEQSVSSIIDIVSSPRVERGQFLLDYDDTRIKVLVSRDDQADLNTMRAGSAIARATLFPGLFMHALVGGISRLSEHRDSAWASVIHAALEKKGFHEIEQERLTENAQHYAQMLLDSPLGKLLNTFSEASNDD